jgi:uncharacterized protein YecE (DUF72 family)
MGIIKPRAMRQTFVGTGGWAYFNVPSPSPLKAYSKAFGYVEVNSTFYEIPPSNEAERWRNTVNGDFHFTVRAHRSITHGRPFEDSDAAHESFNRMLEICRILRADILHLQIPPSTTPDAKLARAISTFLDSTSGGSVPLAIESKGMPSLNNCPDMRRLMQDRGIIHSVDPLKGQTPAYDGGTLYARLFGKGYHNLYQPTDDELRSLDDLASGYNRAFLTFHGARMYSDAARLKTYQVKGIFPRLTNSVGLDSLGKVLAEDARFPSSKAELSSDQGWKLFDSSDNERLRVGEVLSLLPEGTYSSLNELLDAVKEGGYLK